MRILFIGDSGKAGKLPVWLNVLHLVAVSAVVTTGINKVLLGLGF